jgi:ABC-2 type transport system ATP-binding protein
MIEINNISKIYRTNVKEPGLKGAFKNLFHSEWVEKAAVDNVSFQVTEGQAMACIGENGAGKSTLIKMMIGILTPTAGEIKVYGKDPRRSGQEYLRNIGVVFGQKSNLWIDIPVIESYNAIQTLYKLDKKEFQKNFEMVVELLDLAPILSSPARKLSLGQRMKSDIGMVFLHNPKILYLDEPTIGLDINVKHTIRTFLRQMNKEKGISIFLTSHDLDDIDEICEDTIVLSKGKVFYDGTLDNLKHRYVKEKVVKVAGNQKSKIKLLLPEARFAVEGKTTKIMYHTEQYTSEQVLSAISRAFEIEDITIQEPDIDEVVSRIFSKEAIVE